MCVCVLFLQHFPFSSFPHPYPISTVHTQVRELFLLHKAEQLDREMDKIRQREEAGRHVRMLTHEIRQSLDRHRILNTTLVELAQALKLENLTIWMPDAGEGGREGVSE